nr:hypothetical protein [Tanacetum cinerariifolium]
RLARKNKLKALGTLLMALPDKQQLKFNTHKDAKTLMEAIEKSLPTEWRTHTLIWRNKTDLEEQSLDDLFNSLKIYEAELKSSSSASTFTQNIDFVSSSNTDSTNEPVSVAASVSAVSVKIHVSALPNIDADDLEEMDLKWKMVMLTVRARRFHQRTSRNLGVNGPTSMGFDMSKVECYNCHRKGHFVRECRSPKDTRRNGVAEPQRRNVPVETSTSNALVSQCDGVGNYDWSFQADKEPTNYAVMAFTSSSSSSDNEYQSCNGYHAIPPPYTATFMPPKPDLVFHNAPNDVETVHTAFNVELSPTKPDNELSHTHKPFVHIIEDWVSDLEDESETKIPQIVPSFVHPTKQVKSPRPSVKHVETSILTAIPKTAIPKTTSNGNLMNRKACFVPVSTVVPRPTVTRPRQAKTVVTKPNSPPRRHINHSPSPKAINFPPKVTTIKAPIVKAAQGNMSHLSDFEDLNGGYVAFGGNPKGGKISGKGNQSNPSAGVQEQFDANKAGEENVQQYVLFLVWSSGSINPQNTDGDAAFNEKEPEFKEKKPESKVNVSPSSSAQSKKHDDKTKREAKGKSQLEDITYSDDEDDVGAEADFTNLETSITVSPIPTTRVYKDHHVTQIIGDLSSATQTRSMTRVAKDQDLCKDFEKLMKDKFQMSLMRELTFFLGLQVKQKKDEIFISQDKYVAEILWKFGLTDGKSASTPIDTEKPLLKDPNSEDVDVHTYRSMIGSLMYLTLSRPDIMFAVNDVSRLQALVDKKKVIMTKATIRDALRLDDAEGIDCLPNEEIFTELARMGYEKPSTKLTFYKAFFSSQWKFLIYTILQCMSAKRTSWNEFSSSTASAVICYPQKVFANMRRVGKRCSRVETPIFKGMIVEQQVGEGADEMNVEDVPAAGVAGEGAASTADDVIHAAVDEPSIPSPTPPTQPPPSLQDQPSTSQGRMIADMDTDVDLTLKDVSAVAKDDVDIEPAELQEVVKVVTTANLITEVVTAASVTITAAAPQLTTAAAPTLTTTPSAARRRKGVVIRDPEETATPSIIIHSEAKSKDKGKWIMDEVIDYVQRKEKEDNVVKRYQALKRKPQTKAQARKNMMIYLRNVAGFKMDYFKGMTYDDIRPIFEKKFNSNKLDEEVEELKKHLMIVPNDDDDVYIEATPLAIKVPVVDYEIYTENNKPYYKIKRADSSYQLYLSFLSMLRNFDREDFEVLWNLVK